MATRRTPAIWKQVERITTHRTYLRSGIASLISIGKDNPQSMKPAILKQLQQMLEMTADEDESDA